MPDRLGDTPPPAQVLEPDTVAADPVQCSRSMPVDALPCADRQALQMLSPMLWGLVWARPALYWAVLGCIRLYCAVHAPTPASAHNARFTAGNIRYRRSRKAVKSALKSGWECAAGSAEKKRKALLQMEQGKRKAPPERGLEVI